VGIKLIGLFKDTSKANFLVELLRWKKENGFVRRNAVNSLKQLNVWNPEVKKLLIEMLEDPYYEVRAAVMHFLAKSSNASDYNEYKERLFQRMKLKKFTLEEQQACFKIIAKIGVKEDLDLLKSFYLSSNSLVREELLELLYTFFRRKLLSAEELKEHIGKILITSNNLTPDFKLKSIIKRIYKEIEKG
jgi:HEAT repeat protein